MPGFVTEPLGWIGMSWPEADEDKLFQAGRTWLEYGQSLRGQAQQANSTAQKIPSEHQGEAVDAFVAWWNKADGPGQNLGDNAVAAELIGAGLTVMAGITLALKIAYIAQLAILAFEVGQAIATAFVSFGATTAEIPGFVAVTRAICREALNKVISMVEREIAKLFEQAAKLLAKVGAKDLAHNSEKLVGKLTVKAQDRMFANLMSKAGRMDVSSPRDGANFYSGYDELTGKRMRSYAENKTDGVTSTTLEQTPGGKYLDDLRLYGKNQGLVRPEQSDQIWSELSRRYGESAKGDVTAYLHNADPNRVYLHDELPALRANPNVTAIRHVDPVTGEVSYAEGAP